MSRVGLPTRPLKNMLAVPPRDNRRGRDECNVVDTTEEWYLPDGEIDVRCQYHSHIHVVPRVSPNGRLSLTQGLR